jgi:hypothetical protein
MGAAATRLQIGRGHSHNTSQPLSLNVKNMTPGHGKFHALVTIPMILALTGGCSPTRPPVDELDAASRALGGARDAGAAQLAAADYRAAANGFDQAQAAQASGDYDEAAQFARQSLADSELATARARRAAARADVERLRQENAAVARDLATPARLEDQP